MVILACCNLNMQHECLAQNKPMDVNDCRKCIKQLWGEGFLKLSLHDDQACHVLGHGVEKIKEVTHCSY